MTAQTQTIDIDKMQTEHAQKLAEARTLLKQQVKDTKQAYKTARANYRKAGATTIIKARVTSSVPSTDATSRANYVMAIVIGGLVGLIVGFLVYHGLHGLGSSGFTALGVVLWLIVTIIGIVVGWFVASTVSSARKQHTT